MVENRPLTNKEFFDLANHSSDADDLLRYPKPYETYINAPKQMGILVDGIPIYAGFVVNSYAGLATESMLRDGCRAKYAFTLYKHAKNTIHRWVKELGDLRCYMNMSGGEESNMVYRWIRKMGYQQEAILGNRVVMILRKG